ncbi:DMSO/selenate family reductase complex A subunit [Enterobacillus tribolii]|uniref:Anaerobic dimethyl sulfoxide reductase subunit A n=1 Tax=Enterobacillus tribolii TaxID=1487935 RepID=A0A370R2Y2_9GAMM|nr:DMSO/selenate family reductase complex A subunit [Enterobacillus tribolii]MBW7983000.1 dimethyl sulfoxide reductase subunit A [Enterobacillus tribolii]RDK95896.1 anaerobic dimethyl sulfoxide reductase subunit A [Enterobacillus tribolii]
MDSFLKQLLSRSLSRRDLVKNTSKVSSAIALAGAIPLPFSASASAAEVPDGQESVRHSACLVNCGSRCPLRVVVKDDVIVRIEPEDCPDENVFGKHQIRPCLRGRSSRWRVYSPDRLKHPLKRVGKRGEGKFKRISWEEATKYIADELKRIIDKYGNEAVYYNYQSGAYYHNQGTTAWKRLLNITGGYLRYYNTYSTAQISVATPYTFGEYGASHFDQIRHSDLVVFFGMNLSETRMSGGGQVEELRRALESSQAQVIVIDPRYTDSVITEHAEWLPIRPTTDAALVSALAWTLITENLIDEALVNRYCVGFDGSTLPEGAPSNGSYKDYILGTGSDNTPKTPEWAEAITGIAASRIRQLARQIAGAKACYIAQGWGPQRHANGEQSVRAINTLPLLTGHFGLPGTNTGNWPYATKYGVPSLPDGNNPVTTAIPCYLWTDAVLNPEIITDKTHGLRGKEKLDVGIKCIVNQAGNTLVNQHGDINRTSKILEDDTKCEFILVIDNHMTPSAKFADILLPETSYLEAQDLVDNSYASGSHHYMIAMQPVVKPMWEVRSTYDICADIAAHFGQRDAYTEGRTQAQWIEKHYAEVKEKRPYLPEWSQAKEMGVVDQQAATEQQGIALAGFRQDPVANPLKTPSGKAEIYSARLEKLAREWVLPEGDKITALPEFCAAKESHLDTSLTGKYPLQLSGFHTKGHTHSTYSNVRQLHEAAPDEIWMNPLDARQRGIANGDKVRVFNDRGVVEIQCKVTHRIIPGVVAMPEGGWTRRNAAGVDVGGCINTLTSHSVSPLAKGNPQHTNLVEVSKV